VNVTVFGLGYVGCVSAACLADRDHSVTGVDVNTDKIAKINAGVAPISEPGLAEMVHRLVDAQKLRATCDVDSAMAEADIALICVGTPSRDHGALDYRQLLHVGDQLASVLARRNSRPLIAVRSTVMGDILLQEFLPRIERGGAREGRDFDFCVNPEFLREGTAVKDFGSPPLTLIGERNAAAGERLASMYRGIDAPVVRVDVLTASLIKYASNAFHALKIVFANELGVLCERVGADSHAVMEVFCRDTKLNISSAYLRPGFAFGGSCLPKDLRAMLYRARHADADLPALNALLRSNELHIQRAVDAVAATGERKIGIAGLSFKAHTDDLRESPLVTVVEQLIGRGFEVGVYDPDVALGEVFGRNREYIERTVPHIASLLCESLDRLVCDSRVIVVGKRFDDLEPTLQRHPIEGQVLLDLVRMWPATVHEVHGRSLARIC
jgi:GDP-mannose 6-dehydrogenase